MEIRIQDTLSGEKKVFEPVTPNIVTMYNCGPTVYNHAHIGNLRAYVFSDTLRRMFEYNNYEVRQVINVTDIGHLSSDSDDGEDKMTQALKREGKPLTIEAMREVANYYFEEFTKDIEKLNIESPYKFPFASDHIKEDIELIDKLNKAEYTYAISDGIYFDISKFPEYGKLGNIKISDGEDQSRIGMNPEKKNQRDFAVWKFNKDIGFDAPFGKGFPGWHIECSAMSVKYLGSEFDIHTGGIDHIPVHHNNEIAQAKCAGYEYAKYWMHNAHLNIGEEKMAKSGGNFITLKTLEEKSIDPLALRYIFLSARYSSPLQFSWEAIDGAQTAIKRIKDKLTTFPDDGSVVQTEFNSYINDDLDTPKALALVSEVLKDENISDADKKATILDFDRVLGLKLNESHAVNITPEVQSLIDERNEARKNKDFAKSDEIREKIEKLGYNLKDTLHGSELTEK